MGLLLGSSREGRRRLPVACQVRPTALSPSAPPRPHAHPSHSIRRKRNHQTSHTEGKGKERSPTRPRRRTAVAAEAQNRLSIEGTPKTHISADNVWLSPTTSLSQHELIPAPQTRRKLTCCALSLLLQSKQKSSSVFGSGVTRSQRLLRATRPYASDPPRIYWVPSSPQVT